MSAGEARIVDNLMFFGYIVGHIVRPTNAIATHRGWRGRPQVRDR
jgi:hypothetical protein